MYFFEALRKRRVLTKRKLPSTIFSCFASFRSFLPPFPFSPLISFSPFPLLHLSLFLLPSFAFLPFSVVSLRFLTFPPILLLSSLLTRILLSPTCLYSGTSGLSSSPPLFPLFLFCFLVSWFASPNPGFPLVRFQHGFRSQSEAEGREERRRRAGPHEGARGGQDPHGNGGQQGPGHSSHEAA